LTGAFAGVTLTAARFDKAMSSVSAATLASASDMERLREAALQAGADTAFSATEAAEGVEELAKAGVGTADILGGGLAGALDLAAAGQVGVGEAAETAASAMTQFGLAGTDVTHIADLLAAGAGKAQGSVSDMSQALNQSGLVAAQTGLSIEETTGTLAAFASAGLLGSDSGTSFKTMLLRLAAPTGKAAELMSELGISAFDAQGNFVGMAKFAGSLQAALAGMSQQQRQAALSTIFGTDAIRSASIVYQQGQQGIQGWIDATDDQGFAAETAARKLDNLLGDVEALTGSLETLAIESGGGANAGLRILAQTATGLVNQLAEAPPVLTNTAVVLAGVSGAALLAFAAFVKVRRSAALARAELVAMGPAGTKAAAGLQAVTRWAGRAGGALVVLEAAELAANALEDALFDDLDPAIDAVAAGLGRLASGGRLAGESLRVFGDQVGGTSREMDRLLSDAWWDKAAVGVQDFVAKAPGFTGVFTRMAFDLEAPRQQVEALDQSLASLAGESPERAEAAFARLAGQMGLSASETERLRGELSEWRAAAEVGTGQAGDLAGGMSEIGDAAAAAAEDVEDVQKAFDLLFGVQMDLDRAQIALRDGMRDLVEELEDGTRTLKINTQAGRDNRDAVLDQIEVVKGVRDANVANEMSMEDANVLYDKQLRKIEKALVERGFEEDAVRDLIAAYRDVPAKAVTDVEARGVETAITRVQRLQREIRNLTGKTVRVGVVSSGVGGLGGGVFERWGGVLAARSGRLVPAHITSSPTVLYGERATGKEAFIPMRGDPARSLQILAEAASWYGRAITPAQMASVPPAGSRADPAGPGPTGRAAGGQFTGELYLSSGEFLGMVRGEVRQGLAGHTRQLLRQIGQGVGAAP
jgi:TP901 family phage tail tape measure protein